MNKVLIIVLAIIACAIILTVATLLIPQKGAALYCSRSNNTDELYVTNQKLRGFPKWFYRQAVPPLCEVPKGGSEGYAQIHDDAIIDPATKAVFDWNAAAFDFAAWGLVSTGLALTLVKFRRIHV